MFIAFELQVPPEVIVQQVNKKADVLLEGLQRDRLRPVMNTLPDIVSLLDKVTPTVRKQLEYRLVGLHQGLFNTLHRLEQAYTLQLYPSELPGNLLFPRADIYVPGGCGYSVIELNVRGNRLSDVEMKTCFRGALAQRELLEALDQTLNVTGGLLARRDGQVTDADVKATLAPLAAHLYLRRYAPR